MKKLLLKLDRIFTNSKIRKLYISMKLNRISKIINKKTNFENKINYDKNFYNNLFYKLCKKYNCEKSLITNNNHNYSEIYYDLFKLNRKKIRRIFECGVGTKNKNFPFYMSGKKYVSGASLYVWRDFFPNAEIISADLDKSVLFSAKRIKTFYMDQQDKKSIKKLWSNFKNKNFDVIIDDGDHRFNSGVNLFENSYHKIIKGGYYIIEDVSINDINKYIKYFKLKNLNVKYVQLKVPEKKTNSNNLMKSDNNLIIIQKT